VTSESQNVVVCEGLTKQYEELVALQDFNLNLPRAHVFGYIGHNGAGKTTTIRILAGLMTASKGRASICGVDVSSGRDRIKRLVGYMPDSFGVYDQMRVWEYLDFFGSAFKLPKKLRASRIEYVLDVTEGHYMRDRFVDTLSHGMKQRVGIARTLMHDPQVMLLDEPANGLDPQSRVQMRKLIRRLADNGKTVIVSSHILPELAAICDSVGIIHKGVLKASGTVQHVLGIIQRDRLMELKVAGDTAGAQQVLSADSAVSDIDTADECEGLLRFRYCADDSHLSCLLKHLMEKSPVATLREVPMSLEDAYMAISGINLDDASSPAPSGDEAPAAGKAN